MLRCLLACPVLHPHLFYMGEREEARRAEQENCKCRAGCVCRLTFHVTVQHSHTTSHSLSTHNRWRRQQSRRQWPCQIRRDHSFHSIRFATVLVRFFRVHVVVVAADAENCVTVFCALVVLVVVVVPEPHGKICENYYYLLQTDSRALCGQVF